MQKDFLTAMPGRRVLRCALSTTGKAKTPTRRGRPKCDCFGRRMLCSCGFRQNIETLRFSPTRGRTGGATSCGIATSRKSSCSRIPRDPWKYKEFEVSPNGQWIDLNIVTAEKRSCEASCGAASCRMHRQKHGRPNWLFPMRSLTPNFDAKQTWRVNFFRVEGEAEPRFYSAWSPTYSQEPNFHVPGAFGKLVFRE